MASGANKYLCTPDRPEAARVPPLMTPAAVPVHMHNTRYWGNNYTHINTKVNNTLTSQVCIYFTVYII